MKSEEESKIIRNFLRWYRGSSVANNLRIEGVSNTEIIKNYQEFKYKTR